MIDVIMICYMLLLTLFTLINQAETHEPRETYFCQDGRERIYISFGNLEKIYSPKHPSKIEGPCSILISNQYHNGMVVEVTLSTAKLKLVKLPPKSKNSSFSYLDYYTIQYQDDNQVLEPKLVEYILWDRFEIQMQSDFNQTVEAFYITIGAFPVNIMHDGEHQVDMTDRETGYITSTKGFISKDTTNDTVKANCEGNLTLYNLPVTSSNIKLDLEFVFGDTDNCSSFREKPHNESLLHLSIQGNLESTTDYYIACRGNHSVTLDVVGSHSSNQSAGDAVHISFFARKNSRNYGVTIRYHLIKCETDESTFRVTRLHDLRHKFAVHCIHDGKEGIESYTAEGDHHEDHNDARHDSHDSIHYCAKGEWHPVIRCPSGGHSHDTSSSEKVQEQDIAKKILIGVTVALAVIVIAFIVFIIVLKIRCRRRTEAAAAARELEMRQQNTVGRDNPVIANGDVIEVYTPLEVYQVPSQEKADEIHTEAIRKLSN